MSVLIGQCSFQGHPYAGIHLATGQFDLASSILPPTVSPDEPLGLRVVFQYTESKFAQTGSTYFWNTLYRRCDFYLGLNNIELLASNGVVRGTVKDFGVPPVGTLIWQSGNLTIEDLLGHAVTESGYYTVKFELAMNWFIPWDTYICIPIIPGCLWQHDQTGTCSPSKDECIIEALEYTVYVEVAPPPPRPPPDFHFYLDLCAVDKTAVTPTEQFHIQLAIENYNDEAGPFYVGCFCKGKYQQLWQGTWTGNPLYPTKVLTVTANGLAQQQITESQYLAFTFTVSNIPGNPPPEATIDNPEGITGRWTPMSIYVNVSAPPPGKANLSGRVTDRTGVGIAGALVTVGSYSDLTDASGYYSLQGLAVGSYTITVTATGYNDVSQAKRLVEGNNTQNIVMTAEGEPSGISWSKVLGGVAVAAGVVIVLSQASKKGGTSGKGKR